MVRIEPHLAAPVWLGRIGEKKSWADDLGCRGGQKRNATMDGRQKRKATKRRKQEHEDSDDDDNEVRSTPGSEPVTQAI